MNKYLLHNTEFNFTLKSAEKCFLSNNKTKFFLLYKQHYNKNQVDAKRFSTFIKGMNKLIKNPLVFPLRYSIHELARDSKQ